ncbi:hypothetical protein ANCDUO_06378 [Ancylostoma duodenale]|uniref:Uncharacterized protein n=1 Tax=Ancylostoma duodenale TaxID=51022 RepID=A0A0C2DL29_9BILA|nr:hypothetical protein ANCDUO_06378 [Ancylostoma duodenale]
MRGTIFIDSEEFPKVSVFKCVGSRISADSNTLTETRGGRIGDDVRFLKLSLDDEYDRWKWLNRTRYADLRRKQARKRKDITGKISHMRNRCHAVGWQHKGEVLCGTYT